MKRGTLSFISGRVEPWYLALGVANAAMGGGDLAVDVWWMRLLLGLVAVGVTGHLLWILGE